MYTIRVDTGKNRLYVTLVGYFSIDEMKTCGDETIQATARLRPGYDVVTDIPNVPLLWGAKRSWPSLPITWTGPGAAC